jgi:hypothetical protein
VTYFLQCWQACIKDTTHWDSFSLVQPTLLTSPEPLLA